MLHLCSCKRKALLFAYRSNTAQIWPLKYLDTYTQADADGNGKVSDTEFKNALLQSPGLSDDDIGKIYLSSKTTDDSTDEKPRPSAPPMARRASPIICICNIWNAPTTR